MANTSSMTRNQKHGDASSSNRIKTCDNSDAAPWSDLNHVVLLLVMMKLGVIDFLAFSGVCKPWRSLSLSSKKRFMASKPPMLMDISTRGNEKEWCLEDFEGRKFKSIIPHSKGRKYVGLICGYLILYGSATRDFWLVNPITSHELHFPCAPAYVYSGESRVSAILVFSSSTSKWLFVISRRFTCRIWFSIAGEGAWYHVSSTSEIFDIHAFKGKIYTLHSVDHYSWEVGHLCEMRLNPEPKLTLLKTKDFLKQNFFNPKFVSSGENLYVMETCFKDSDNIHELDFGERKWLPFEETRDEYEFFNSDPGPVAAIIRRYDVTDKREICRFFTVNLWYFPHQCLFECWSDDLFLFFILSYVENHHPCIWNLQFIVWLSPTLLLQVAQLSIIYPFYVMSCPCL